MRNSAPTTTTKSKKKQPGNAKKKTKVKLLDLPTNILLDIFSRLPTASLIRLKRVSRTYSGLAIMHTGYKCTHPDLDPPQHRVFLAEAYSTISRSHSLGFIYCGLVGLRDFDKKGPLFLYNPMRSELVSIPYPPHEFYSTKHSFDGMGYDATTSNHKLVYVCDKGGGDLVADVLVLDTSSWRRIPYCAPCCVHAIKYDMNFYAYGSMHWLLNHEPPRHVDPRPADCAMRENLILSFDFEREKFEWTHPNFPGNVDVADSQKLFLIRRWKGIKESMAVINMKSDKKLEIQVFNNHTETDEDWTIAKVIVPEFTIRNRANLLVLICGNGEEVAGGCSCYVVFSYSGSLISLKNYGELLRWSGFPYLGLGSWSSTYL